MKANPDILATAPTLFRSSIARGLTSDDAIDRTGGDYGAGVIRGVAVITRGEALGHGLWVDDHFLGQVEAALKADPGGVRARFTHPGMSGDGLGRKLGRMKFAGRSDGVVRGDLHFSKGSHTTPEGDLASYVMGLAEEDPDLFGASIAFERDYDAEAKVPATEADGNAKGLPPVRLAKLAAVDIVDFPAANPGGLFHVGDIPAEAEALANYVLGLSDTAPACDSLGGINAERLRGYFARFMAGRGLRFEKKQATPQQPVAASSKPKVPTPKPWEEYTGALGLDRGIFWFSVGLPLSDATKLDGTEFGRRIQKHDPADQLTGGELSGLAHEVNVGQWVALGAFPPANGKDRLGWEAWSVESICRWAAAGCPDRRGRLNEKMQNMVGVDRPREY